MKKENNYKGWIFLAPAIIFLFLFALYPIINTFYISFLKNYRYFDGSFDGFTFSNYAVMLGLEPFPSYLTGKGQVEAFMRYALPNTILITLITVPITVGLALVISALLNSIKKFQKALQTVLFMPYVTNIIAVGMVFAVVFSNNGIFNQIFNLGIKRIPDAAGDTTYLAAITVLCIELVWYGLPFKILVFLGGLQGIDKQYYEAAQIDGTGKVKSFFKITVPLLSPQIAYIMITSFISGFKEYQAVAGIFNQRGTSALSYNLYTAVYFIYDQIQTGGSNIAYGCAGAIILFILIITFTFARLYISKKKVVYNR